MTRLATFGKNRAGSVAILSAVSGVLLIGFTAVAVDGANVFLVKRRQQTATDLAAIAGAAGLDRAAGRASEAMAANGFGAATLDVSTGTYTADAARAPTARFNAGPGGNAVRVSSTTVQPLIFGGALQALLGVARPSSSATSGITIRAQATARKQDLAAFTLGSGVATLDSGLLNAVLGSVLGTKLSLSLLDYQSLAGATVDLFDYTDALATRLHASGPTYGSVAAGVTSQSALFAGLADALSASPTAATAVRAIAATLPTGATASLARVVDFGPAGSLTIGAAHPISARVSALDLLSALVRLCGDGHLVSVDLGLSLPGLGSTRLQVALGEPAQSANFSAVGAEGASLRTAQIRVQLTTQVEGPGLPAALNLPIYLDVAPASATLSAVTCTDPTQPSATLNVVTGLARAAIGTVMPGDMLAFTASPIVTPATVIDLAPVLRVTASAQVSLSSSGSVPVPFAAADITAHTVKTISSQPSLAVLLGSLAGNTRVSVSILGAALPQPSLPAAVSSAITAVMTPLDAALQHLLAIFGIAVGNAATTVTGVRCGQGILVN